VRNGQEISKIS